MLSTESEQLLNEIYYNVNHPAGFSNASRLYHVVKGKGIKLKDVREFLSRQRSHQLTRPNRYNYTRRSTVSIAKSYSEKILTKHWADIRQGINQKCNDIRKKQTTVSDA